MPTKPSSESPKKKDSTSGTKHTEPKPCSENCPVCHFEAQATTGPGRFERDLPPDGDSRKTERRLIDPRQHAGMTAEEHIDFLNEAFTNFNRERYLRGRAEHMADGDPALPEWDIGSLIDAAFEEAVDQVNYLLTLRAKWRELNEEV